MGSGERETHNKTSCLQTDPDVLLVTGSEGLQLPAVTRAERPTTAVFRRRDCSPKGVGGTPPSTGGLWGYT